MTLNLFSYRAFFTLLLITFVANLSYAQGVTIGSNNPPDSSAALDIQDTTGGFLLPRLTTTQRNAINNPAIGLQIFNTTTKCVQIYMPQSGWINMACDCPTPPSSAFTYMDSASISENVIFIASYSGLTYSWTFQNGNPATSSQQIDTVSWGNTGIHSVTLTVTDNIGCSSTTTDSIYIDSCSTVIGNSSVTFNYTGSMQLWTVPNYVCAIKIECWGAEGGQTGAGKGGYVQGVLAVTPGDTLYIYVGQKGGGPGSGTTFGGGGNAGNSNRGGGGGASDVRVGGQTLYDRIIVAGGGGGANIGGYGGDGGGLVGGNGSDNNAFGGTQNAPGTGSCCPCTPPTFGVGQNGSCNGCNGSGGGGGWYGGGACTQGGGGSGYIGGVSNGAMQSGIQTGNGKVVITY